MRHLQQMLNKRSSVFASTHSPAAILVWFIHLQEPFSSIIASFGTSAVWDMKCHAPHQRWRYQRSTSTIDVMPFSTIQFNSNSSHQRDTATRFCAATTSPFSSFFSVLWFAQPRSSVLLLLLLNTNSQESLNKKRNQKHLSTSSLPSFHLVAIA